MWATPIQSSVPVATVSGVLRSGCRVEVDEPERLVGGGARAGDGADADRAVAAEHDGDVAGPDRRLHALRDLAGRLHDAGRVLGAAARPVGAPAAAEGDVAKVGRCCGEAGVAEGAGRLLLAGGEGAEAGGGSDEGGLHNRPLSYTGDAGARRIPHEAGPVSATARSSSSRSSPAVSGATTNATTVARNAASTYTDTANDDPDQATSAVAMIGASAPPKMPASW